MKALSAKCELKTTGEMKMNKKRVYLMCGVPGSGKSTWIKENLNEFEGTTKVVSRDQIRFSLLEASECSNYFDKEKEVYKEFISQIKASIKENDNTIIDATHLTEKSRNKIFSSLQPEIKDCQITVIWIKVSLATALARNEKRIGKEKVPVYVIKDMFNKFETPMFAEGFHHLRIVLE